MADKWLCVEHTAAIAMGSQTADMPFFVSANVVSGSCFSFISQCNCLMSKLLQEHSKGSFGKKNTPFFLFYDNVETTAKAMATKCTDILKSP